MDASASDRRKMTAAVNQIIVDRKFSVAKKGKDICLIKMIGKRPVTIMLKDVGEGYWIEPPKHEFSCSYSHFDFAETEMRYTRRKDLLLRLVLHLQKTHLWKYIVNKSFFVVNTANKKMDKRVIRSQYEAALKG